MAVALTHFDVRSARMTLKFYVFASSGESLESRRGETDLSTLSTLSNIGSVDSVGRTRTWCQQCYTALGAAPWDPTRQVPVVCRDHARLHVAWAGAVYAVR